MRYAFVYVVQTSEQALNLKLIEKEFPGITQLEYDEKGRIIVDDVSDEEVEMLVAQLVEEYR